MEGDSRSGRGYGGGNRDGTTAQHMREVGVEGGGRGEKNEHSTKATERRTTTHLHPFPCEQRGRGIDDSASMISKGAQQVLCTRPRHLRIRGMRQTSTCACPAETRERRTGGWGRMWGGRRRRTLQAETEKELIDH